jgi:transposase
MNAATVEKKRFTHWTDEELEMLISLYRQGLKYKEIAAQIGRPLSTIESKIKIYRKTGSLSRPDRSGQELQKGFTAREVAAR